MTLILNFFRENLRNNFAATVFMMVAGFIALIFVGYLVIDFIKVQADAARRKKKHRAQIL